MSGSDTREYLTGLHQQLRAARGIPETQHQQQQAARRAQGDALYQQFMAGDDAARWDMLNAPGSLGRGGTLSALRRGFMRATGADTPLDFNATINRFGGGARPDGGQSAMPTGQGSMTPQPQMLAAALRQGGSGQGDPFAAQGGLSALLDRIAQQHPQDADIASGGAQGAPSTMPYTMPAQWDGGRQYAGGSPTFNEFSGMLGGGRSPGGGQFGGLNRQMYPVAPPLRGMPNRNTGMFLGPGGQFSSGLPQSAY